MVQEMGKGKLERQRTAEIKREIKRRGRGKEEQKKEMNSEYLAESWVGLNAASNFSFSAADRG
jgi:hypothetical protein